MEQAIKIRPAGAEELTEVESLIKTAYREFQPLMPEAAWSRWMDNIRETIQAPDGVLLVAGDRGRIQGAVKFYPDAGQAHQGQWPAGAASIRLLAVAPANRGRGYGPSADPGLPEARPGSLDTHHFPVHRDLYGRGPSAL